MRIEGQRTYAASREILWALLNDPFALQRCWPGCRSLEAIGPDEYRAEMEVRVGRVVERFNGALHREQVIPYLGFNFVADGQNPDGSLLARGRITLEDAAGGDTTLGYEIDLNVAGRPATVSERMLLTTARSLLRRSLDALESEAATRTRVYTTTVTGPETRVMPVEASRRLLTMGRWLALALALLGALLLWRGLERRQARHMAHQVAGILEQMPAVEAAAPAGVALREAA